MLILLLLLFGAGSAFRFTQNPVITPQSGKTIGANINGPSLIRVPPWINRPLGRYYLYFGHHAGTFIRLAYADRLEGPWTVHEPGTLKLPDVKPCKDHIASPDVHVDDQRRQIRMYFHCVTGEGRDIAQQSTLVAISGDGIHFTARPQSLGPAYFRVFQWKGDYYAVVRGGTFFRSRDGLTPFAQGPTLFRSGGVLLRHAAVDLQGDVLSVFYSRIGDMPERILVSTIRLTRDWLQWRDTGPEVVLEPATDYEGANLPLQPSKPDEAPGRVRQLRDPAIFREAGRTYLLYSVAGESGIGIAQLQGR